VAAQLRLISLSISERTSVADGGEMLDRIPLEDSGFTAGLGGADGQTLSCNVPDWHLDDDFVDNLRAAHHRSAYRAGAYREC
jgi:hypothetical protein